MDLNLDLARLKGYIHSLKQSKHNTAINLRSPFSSLVRRQYHYRHCQHDQWSASWLSSAHLPALRHCSKLDWNWECSRLSRSRQLSQPAITTFLSILQEEEEGNQTNLRKRRAGLGKEVFWCRLLRNLASLFYYDCSALERCSWNCSGLKSSPIQSNPEIAFCVF